MSAEPLSPGAPGGGGARSACWEVQRAALRGPAAGCRRPPSPARCGVRGAVLVARWGCGEPPSSAAEVRGAALVARCGVREPPLSAAPRRALCGSWWCFHHCASQAALSALFVYLRCQVIKGSTHQLGVIGVVRESCNLISGLQADRPRRATRPPRQLRPSASCCP